MWAAPADQFDHFAAIGGAADHGDVPLRIESRPEALTDHRLVIHNDDPN